MLNYICSELYRITHTRPAYVLAAILCAGILAINLALHFWGGGVNYYGHTSFSYALNISEPFLYVIMGAVVAFALYESRRKNGNLKNTVAFGLTRPQIFIGQCISALLAATAIMVVVLAVWLASAELLLSRTEIWTIGDFLSSTAYVYLLAIAGLVSTVFFIAIFQREMTAVVSCIAVWNFFSRRSAESLAQSLRSSRTSPAGCQAISSPPTASSAGGNSRTFSKKRSRAA